jgi:nucleoside-diphosphate-sugar epimerase
MEETRAIVEQMPITDDFSEQLAGKSVLVTGASGFIGSHLCQRLSECGARIHAVSRKAHSQQDGGPQWWQADCADFEAMQRIVKAAQPQLVFHLASYVAGARSLQAVLPTFHDNLASTVHLLTAVAEAGCQRVVLASSSEEPQAFDGASIACSPYAAAKWASNVYGRMFHQLFQVPVVMPRIFMTYGPDQKDTDKLVPSVVLQLLRGQAPKLSSGRRRADWIYVDDVVEGLLRAALVPGIEGSSFDLGTGLLLSVRQIVERIAAIIGPSIEPAFGALPDRPFEQERPADTDFLLSRLGYKPSTAVAEGLESTVAWYRRHLSIG